MKPPTLIGDPFRVQLKMSNGKVRRRIVGRYLCGCGKEFVTNVNNIKTGNTQSCGCFRAVVSSERTKTHGMTGTTTYHVWSGMQERCRNPKNKKWHNYGGRGVRVCDRWQSFENFLADMGEAPEGKSIDRHPDQNGNYEPGNCRWATGKEQCRNKRNNIVIQINGESMTVVEWSETTGAVSAQLIYARLHRGWPPEEAVYVPARKMSIYRRKP